MTTRHFEFELSTHLVFEFGGGDRLGERIASSQWERAGLLVDAGAARCQAVQRLRQSLESTLTETRYVENAVAEPTYEDLESLRTSFTDLLDVVVGVGGGSTMDLAKGLAGLATNAGPAIGYRGFDLLEAPSLPIVAVPTTAGTGSEVTPYAVFTDTAEGRKLGINSNYNRPAWALLDPLLTIECPHGPTLSSGIDAMVHALEGYVAQGATPISRVFSAEALLLVYSNLPVVLGEPTNAEARGAMLRGAYLAGAGLMNAGAGPAGALSYPLGVQFRVPHGLAGGAFLAGVARHNVEHQFFGYADLGRRLGLPGADDRDLSLQFVDHLEAWFATIEAPKLPAFGVTVDDIPTLVTQTFDGLAGAIKQNPVSFSEDDATTLLERLMVVA